VISGPTTAVVKTSLIQFEKLCSLVILMSAPVRQQKMHFVFTAREASSVADL